MINLVRNLCVENKSSFKVKTTRHHCINYFRVNSNNKSLHEYCFVLFASRRAILGSIKVFPRRHNSKTTRNHSITRFFRFQSIKKSPHTHFVVFCASRRATLGSIKVVSRRHNFQTTRNQSIPCFSLESEFLSIKSAVALFSLPDTHH